LPDLKSLLCITIEGCFNIFYILFFIFLSFIINEWIEVWEIGGKEVGMEFYVGGKQSHQ